MTLILSKTDFSIITVSIIGGVAHNIGQLLIAMLIVESASLVYYAPALLIAGILTGAAVGAVTAQIVKLPSDINS